MKNRIILNFMIKDQSFESNNISNVNHLHTLSLI